MALAAFPFHARRRGTHRRGFRDDWLNPQWPSAAPRSGFAQFGASPLTSRQRLD
jgi:hypothetical protein